MRKRRRGSCLKCQGFISHSPCPCRSERSCLSCRFWIILISRAVLCLLMGLCCSWGCAARGAVLFVRLCCWGELEIWQVCVKQLPGSPKPLAPAQNKHMKTKAELGVICISSWSPASCLPSGPNLPALVHGAGVEGEAALWFWDGTLCSSLGLHDCGQRGAV